MSTTVDTASNGEKLLTADGSALYYALLYVKQPASVRVLETLKFIQTLSNTLNDVTEGDVAEKKIHWWHEELTRLSKQQARHPACIAVQSYLQSYLSIEASLAILSATASERYNSFDTEYALNKTTRADYRARLKLFEAALDSPSRTNTQTSTNPGTKTINLKKKSELLLNNEGTSSLRRNDAIALGLGQFDRLNSLAKRLRNGYPVFSDERYQEYGLMPEDLLNHPSKSAKVQQKKQALLDNAISNALASVENAIGIISEPAVSKPTNLPIQILCMIRYAQLKLWKKRKTNLINESITLTPLRKFIIAYRCKRRFEQQ